MDMFYKEFEDNFRGSRSSIKTRLAYYLPLLEVMKNNFSNLKVLDLGCGRGEWLELLTEKGIFAEGVDLDTGMLSECKTLGLKHTKSDALDFLNEQPTATFDVISCFHLIEHIPFESLKVLIKESERVLKPGGILIMETPNSENLLVGTSSFYLDPSHQRPLPADLVCFLTIFFGFARSNRQFINGCIDNLKAYTPSLFKVLNGVGPDYTVIAQKNISGEQFNCLDTFFIKNNDYDLQTLVREFDERIREFDERIHALDFKHSTVANYCRSICKSFWLDFLRIFNIKRVD